MCTRFVYNGKDRITGFNFDIDLSVWDHKVMKEKDRFYIGIKMPDNRYHSFHGIHRNGNTGTLLYVHGNPQGENQQPQEVGAPPKYGAGGSCEVQSIVFFLSGIS